MTNTAELVRKWFDIVGQASGPLLPDGWFGKRPFDNFFFLEEVRLLDDTLLVQLSEETTLRFDGHCRVCVENSDLVFNGFRRATLRWRHYGSGDNAEYCERIYDEGQIRLAAPIGKQVELT